MREIVVISGKGGTGKTSLAASFACLAERPVIADCDVDAADLHLVLRPSPIRHQVFRGGYKARIDPKRCQGCGKCASNCRFDAVKSTGLDPASSNCLRPNALSRPAEPAERIAQGVKSTEAFPADPPSYWIDPFSCEGCGVCVRFCPAHAIEFDQCVSGEWTVSETRCGPMVHAKLGVAAENSGKLVSAVRKEARRIALAEGRPQVIVDGPPGIGCPVIAAITGSSMVVVITEPTVSGEHDMKRVLSLAAHFRIPAVVCLNKWDLNPEMAERIEAVAESEGGRLLGRIRYDPAVTAAQIREKAIVETDAPSGEDIRRIWERLESGVSGVS